MVANQLSNRNSNQESQPEGEPAKKRYGPSTLAVHAGRSGNPYHAVSEPIVQTATYVFADSAELSALMEARMWGQDDGRIEYGRYGNPTVRAVEKRLAAIDNAGDALLFSSGMAAITTILLALIPTGKHIILTDDSYRRTRQFCTQFLKRLGISCTIVPMSDYQAIEAAIHADTRLMISESPTNPYLRTLDLEKFVEIGKRHGVKTLLDATFATPFNINPLDWGIDLVVHSATKYIAGHNDILAGVVTGSEGLIASLRNALGILGAIVDPHNASLLLRGLKTLGLRIERQNQNGQLIAEFLENHPSVEDVWYPGLPSHPDHEVAKRQMRGYGGVVSFSIRADFQGTSDFIDRLEIPLIAASLGGVESLVEQPAIMSYYELSPEERLSFGIKGNLVRLSLGIEDSVDLIADLDQALRDI